MKTGIKGQVLLLALITGLGLVLAGRAAAQTFTPLHPFSGGTSDGGDPEAGLVLSANGKTLYGTTPLDGMYGQGTVFAVNIDGSGYMVLHNFNGSDGGSPECSLVLLAGTLYGTTHLGGSAGYGTVFALNIAAAIGSPGAGLTTLYDFTGGSDGSQLLAGLVLSADGYTLYGTTTEGGSAFNLSGNGTVFAYGLSGSTSPGLTTLYTFTGGSDGKHPAGRLVLSANGKTLYGMTPEGGTGYGTIFAVNTDGSTQSPPGPTLMPLYTFTGGTDGVGLYSDLVLSDNTLYGAAGGDSVMSYGTVFAYGLSGSTSPGFRILYTFTGGTDGSDSEGGLILSGSTLYGTTQYGGSSPSPNGDGTVFALNILAAPGTGLTAYPLPFTVGANANGDLILSGDTLYGTTQYPAPSQSGDGTVFSLSLSGGAGGCVPPPANLVLWLPFDELTGPSAGNMAPVFDKQPGIWVGSPVPVVGQYVANSLQFFGSQYVDVANYPEINIGTNDLTIDAWVYTTNSNSPPSVIVDKRDTLGTGYGYSLAISYGSLVLQLAGPPGGTFVNYEDSSPTVVTPNQWVFVAVSVHQDPNPANSLASFYVNGAPTSATPLSPGQTDVSNTHDLWVGAGILSGNQPWQGYLDEVEVFDRALTAAEIQGIYNAGAAGKCKPCCYLNPSTLTISTTGTNSITLTWNGCGTLEESPSLTGPWTIASTTSPFTVTPSGSAGFFQLTCP